MVNVERAPFNLHPGHRASAFYSTFPWQTPGSATAVAATDTLYLYPFYMFRPATIVSLHLRIQTGGAGSAIKSGIWANSPVSHRPLGAPLVADNTGQATTASTTTTAADITDTPLAPGWYWAGSKATGTLPVMYSVPTSNLFCSAFMGFGTSTAALVGSGISIASTYADNLPTLAGGASFTNHTGGGIPVLIFGT